MAAAVDTMVLIYYLPFPAVSYFLASGSDVKVVRAYRQPSVALGGVFAVGFAADTIFLFPPGRDVGRR